MVGARSKSAGPDDHLDVTIPDSADVANTGAATRLAPGWSSGANTGSTTTQKQEIQDTKVLAATVEERRVSVRYVWNFSKITNSARSSGWLLPNQDLQGKYCAEHEKPAINRSWRENDGSQLWCWP